MGVGGTPTGALAPATAAGAGPNPEWAPPTQAIAAPSGVGGLPAHASSCPTWVTALPTQDGAAPESIGPAPAQVGPTPAWTGAAPERVGAAAPWLGAAPAGVGTAPAWAGATPAWSSLLADTTARPAMETARFGDHASRPHGHDSAPARSWQRAHAAAEARRRHGQSGPVLAPERTALPLWGGRGARVARRAECGAWPCRAGSATRGSWSAPRCLRRWAAPSTERRRAVRGARRCTSRSWMLLLRQHGQALIGGQPRSRVSRLRSLGS